MTHRVSVECPTFRTLLVTLYRHDANTPAQDRSQLGVAELVKGAVVVDRRVDDLHRLPLETVGDLLEGPGLLVLSRGSTNAAKSTLVMAVARWAGSLFTHQKFGKWAC